MHGFLSKASFLLRKDKTTVRRWCERGLIPGTYRTTGGHWRANGFSAKTANAVLRRVREAGFSRERAPAGWSQAKAKMHARKIEVYRLKRDLYMSEDKLLRREMRDFDADYFRRRMALPGVTHKTAYDAAEYHKLRKQKFTEAEIAAYERGAAFKSNPSDKIETASGEAAIRARVINSSRMLRLNNVKLTRKNLAREMKVSESPVNRLLRTIRQDMNAVKDHVAVWYANYQTEERQYGFDRDGMPVPSVVPQVYADDEKDLRRL
jgi:DNA-binding TFAR19-related protein (PDSD5 family)